MFLEESLRGSLSMVLSGKPWKVGFNSKQLYESRPKIKLNTKVKVSYIVP